VSRTFWILVGLVSLAVLFFGGPERDRPITRKRRNWWT
jgi:hypothetical protein